VGVVAGSYFYDKRIREKADQEILELNTTYNENTENVSNAVYKVQREMIELKLYMKRQEIALYLLGVIDLVIFFS